MDIVRSGGGDGGGSGWWARFLRILRGAAADDSGEQSELVRLETEADVEALIGRFTPAFLAALDALFDQLAMSEPSRSEKVKEGTAVTAKSETAKSETAGGERVISEGAALSWLELVNRELGRGGTYRGVMSALEASEAASGARVLSRRAWHGLFAQELGEGKWWQVAYDLEVSGVPVDDFEMEAATVAYRAAAVRSSPVDGEAMEGGKEGEVEAEAKAKAKAKVETKAEERDERTPRSVRAPRRHYEAWLDYVYYSSDGLRLLGYQESLDEEQAKRIYQEGDALPNAWHPSDHLPVGCVFEWARQHS